MVDELDQVLFNVRTQVRVNHCYLLGPQCDVLHQSAIVIDLCTFQCHGEACPM